MGRRMVVVLLVVGLLVAAWGCRSTRTSSGATVGATGYITGAYQKTYQASVADTYNAALSMLDANHIPVYKKQVGSSIGMLEGTLADGKTLTMDFKATGVNATIVTIKVGTFGDMARSNFFFEQLNSRMPAGTAVGSAGQPMGTTSGAASATAR